MSSRASFVTVPAANAGDALANNYIMQVVGARYEAVPTAVADGQARGFLIDSYGRQIVIGGEAPNAARTLNPIGLGGEYNLVAPTYDDGDLTMIQTTANGYLIVTDAVIAALDKGAGAVTANTLRVQPTVEALTNVYEIQGDAADNAAASGNPVRSGGVYNSSLPTYDNGDAGTFQLDVNGYLLVRDPVVAARSVNSGATDATTLRIVPASDAQIFTKGVDADNAAPTVNPIAVAGRYNSSAPTYGDGDIGFLQIDANGRARVVVESDIREGLSVITSVYNAYSGSNLPGNATNPLELVASLAADVKKISVWDTAGVPCELMIGAAASETRKLVLGPGADGEFEVDIPSGTRVSIRRLDSASALAVGDLTINFLG